MCVEDPFSQIRSHFMKWTVIYTTSDQRNSQGCISHIPLYTRAKDRSFDSQIYLITAIIVKDKSCDYELFLFLNTEHHN